EHEIDECQRYAPCVHGTCVDKIADYDCECATDYGGKNCSVLLIGCSDVECVNGGTCVPLLFEEIVHEFRCDCPPGFTGRNCELVTTVSMNGDAYLILDSHGTHGYDLRMSFRTTLPSVVLAVGQGEDHYFTLVLQDGRLKLHSSFLSRYNGIYSGSELNNGEWQFIQMLVNDTHSLLTSNNETTQHSLSPLSTISFTSTFLGGVTSNLKILAREPSYTGCMRDVSLNDNDVILSELPQNSKVNVVEGCNRVPQCQPNPCHNDGQCVDLWTSMKCLCKRPYLGDTCRMRQATWEASLCFTPATFGNEDIRDSLATVNIPPSDQQTFQRYVDISMLVRTKQDSGLIFYLGSPLESANQLGKC
ncbi:UNVERIFIED_CONTAM: hypothetical protein GTU68_065618, partial [Idotea baltica]|nr:hypothetical protein [Idotea baltica]